MSGKHQKESVLCSLKILSPVHLGCDEVFEPTGFSLDEDNFQLIHFDTTLFIKGLSEQDRREYSRICKKGTPESILELYKFLRGRTAEGERVNVCNEFRDHYHQVLDLPLNDVRKILQELNDFSIGRTAFNSIDHRPYIPGSAVKGALRTAILNHLAKSNDKHINTSGKYPGSKLEAALLNLRENNRDIPLDPFRLLKVSDFRPVGHLKTKIIYAVNKKKKLSKFEAKGPYQMLEVVEPGSVFSGTISVEQPEKKAGIKNPLSLEKVLNSAALFYKQEKTREDNELKNAGLNPLSTNGDKSTLFLRLGRHSGAESITVEGYRDIRIMQAAGKAPKYEDSATTFWLASETRKPSTNKNLIPFGWTSLATISSDDQKQFDEINEEWRHEKAARQDEEKQAREDRLREKKALEEERERTAQEQRQREEEEKERLARLKTMSPAERDVEYFKQDNLEESEVFKIYERLDSYNEEEQQNLALLLKEYWQSTGKWKKKESSKKQRIKVQKIKKILKEN